MPYPTQRYDTKTYDWELSLYSQGMADAALMPKNTRYFKALDSLIHTILPQSIHQQPLYLSSGLTSVQDDCANISYFVRTLMPESVSAQAMGLSTVGNSFQGFWAAYQALIRYRKALTLNDKNGQIEGGLDTGRGVFQSLGGTTCLGYRGAQIVADISQVDSSILATTTLGKAAFWIGTISDAFFALFYLLIAAWSAHGLREDLHFRAALEAANNDRVDVFRTLMKKAVADPQARLNVIKHLSPKDLCTYKKALEKSALAQLSESYLHLQDVLFDVDQLDGPILNQEEAEQLIQEGFIAHDQALRESSVYEQLLGLAKIDKTDLQGIDFSPLALLGFSLNEKMRQDKKIDKLSRVTSHSSVLQLTKLAKRGLSIRLESENALIKNAAEKEFDAIEQKIRIENNKAIGMHTVLFIVGLCGIAASILAFLMLNPAGSLTIVTLLICVGMGIVDTDCAFTGADQGPSGKYDKLYLAACTTLVVISFALSVGLTLYFALPLVPLVIAIGLAGAELLVLEFAYVKLLLKEKSWNEQHLTLADLKEHLDNAGDEPVDEKTLALLKKLPKEDRLAIKKQYLSKKNIDCVVANKQWIIKAIKKVTHNFWNIWWENKTQENAQLALKIQEIVEELKETEQNQNSIKKIQQLKDTCLAAYDKFTQEMQYLAKLHQSKAILRNVLNQLS